MWCPKCRNEYINGVTTCVDCGCDLVEELPEEIDENEPVAIGSLAKEETAAKLVSYLNRAGLLSCAVRPQPENEEGEIPAYDIIVAGKELVYIHQLFDGLTEDAEHDHEDLGDLAGCRMSNDNILSQLIDGSLQCQCTDIDQRAHESHGKTGA